MDASWVIHSIIKFLRCFKDVSLIIREPSRIIQVEQSRVERAFLRFSEVGCSMRINGVDFIVSQLHCIGTIINLFFLSFYWLRMILQHHCSLIMYANKLGLSSAKFRLSFTFYLGYATCQSAWVMGISIGANVVDLLLPGLNQLENKLAHGRQEGGDWNN